MATPLGVLHMLATLKGRVLVGLTFLTSVPFGNQDPRVEGREGGGGGVVQLARED